MAAANPNPTRITDQMWWLWLACQEFIPGVRLGGIYADKSGYHNTVNANLAKWPGNYSIRYAIDRQAPKDKARAIDLTMNATWMRTITQRLLDGAARRDPRMRCVKEFYGTVDGVHVVGRLKDSETGPYRSGSSDTSHTWHEHIGLLTPFVDDIEAVRGLLSLLRGESLESYLGGTMDRIIAEHGDSGAWVDFTQRHLQAAGAKLTRDGKWGNETTAAMKWWFVNVAGGSSADFDGRSVTGWILREFLRREATAIAKAVVAEALADLAPTAPTQAQVDAAVATYLTAHPVKLPENVQFTSGTLTGVKAK